jgi:hypothetical protein
MSILTWAFGRLITGQRWRAVRDHHVHLAFLRAEWHHLRRVPGADERLVTTPDLKDPVQNRRRRELLWLRRGPLLEHVPCSTKWYEVEFLEERHLQRLLVIGRCPPPSWDAPGVHKNELEAVTRRCAAAGVFPDGKPLALTQAPAGWDPPILWGHRWSGPLTILEGNHRLIAYKASAEPKQLCVRTFVGLSRDYCYWHLPDPP